MKTNGQNINNHVTQVFLSNLSQVIMTSVMMKNILLLLWGMASAADITTSTTTVPPQRSFEIDYENDGFLKDGQPFRYVSGTIHYFRVHPTDWADRLQKLRRAGFNAVQTYVEWSSHEPEPGVYDFTEGLDLEAYLQEAQKQGLLVILRPGPFIDAERDMGGLPYWLLRINPLMRLRSSDQSYMKYVNRWLGDILSPKLKPYLYENGGPIIMIQVENEYGSYYACDFAYTAALRDLYRSKLGDKIVLFTTDGSGVGYLKCGKIPGTYATVDFGAGGDVTKPFEAQRLFEPRGPLINSEFYPGWLDHWGAPHATVESSKVCKSLDDMLALNASVNVYVFHGGTSFGFGAGANLGGTYQACPTSYDYDAPVSEAGDPTQKYFDMMKVISKYLSIPSGPEPKPTPKEAYGDVPVIPIGSLFELAEVSQSVIRPWPVSFEDLSVQNGLVLYQTNITFMVPDPARLSLNDVHDRAYVFVDENLIGVASREQDISTLPIFAKVNSTLSIIVESQGRVCFGSGINDLKGLLTNVTLNGYQLKNWRMTPLPLTHTQRFKKGIARMLERGQDIVSRRLFGTPQGGMTFYWGEFDILDNPKNTFLRLDGWTKGLVWINNFLIGRYWPVVGPQQTLFVPHGILKMGPNEIFLLEQEASPCSSSLDCKVVFVDTPVVNGPTPK
ncbi:beta-galactosidase-like isoform X2 [Oratosquilla oratoria]|uniref:beta-galactosidase-like isoform X2 n=2 Tax=Oratosquilla oratoria TaxID=337810 RepID=UPI003F76837A